MADSALVRMLVVIATSAGLSYLLRRASRSRPSVDSAGNLVLTYPLVLRVFGAIGSLGLACLAAYILKMAASEPQSPATLVLLAVVAIGLFSLGIYGALEFPLVRIELRPDGIWGRSPWSGTKFLPWGSITSVDFSPSAQWLTIRGHNGRAIRAHLYLSGIRSLYQALKQHVPNGAWRARYKAFE